MTGEEGKTIRIQAGLSLEELADMLNLGPNGADRIREFERGKRDYTGPVIRLLELLEAGAIPDHYLPAFD